MSVTPESVRPHARWRRRDHLLVAAAGLVVLAACSVAVRHGTVSAAERRVFHAVNDLPQWLYRPMWVFQQFGNIAVAFVVVLLVAVLARRPRLIAAAAVILVAKLALERVVKQIVERARPGTTIGDVVLRGDVSRHGLSFVSGHAVMTVAVAVVVTPVLPRRWKVVPWVLAALNGVARIYVGAHNPLDIVGGMALGLVIGGVVNAVLAPVTASPAAERVGPPPSGVAVTPG